MAFRHAATVSKHSFALRRTSLWSSTAYRSTNNIPFRLNSSSTSEADTPSSKAVYLHVGPSGDCWTGSSIFAAKHLQPDYVKSVPLDMSVEHQERLVDILEERTDLAHQIYDTGRIPPEVWTIMEEDST